MTSGERERYYEYAFAPAADLGTWIERLGEGDAAVEAWRTELRELGPVNRSSGAILGAALDGNGNEMFLPERPEVPLRYSCGATLISPSLVITAAHCVAIDTGPTTLQMFRPTRGLVDRVPATLQLSGSWPDFTHETLDAEDGYLFDEYPCEIVVRCDDRWGELIDCPLQGMQDVAVLSCSGSPGARYGFQPIAAELPLANDTVFMPWKHEVYDLDASSVPAEELYNHYVLNPGVEQNFHYQGAGRNQLLPLRSKAWQSGAPRRMNANGWTDLAWTDLMGCHGTSGSGMFRVDGARYELWGLATSGGYALLDGLCQDTEDVYGAGYGEGSELLGSNWHDLGPIVDQISDARAADCAALATLQIRRTLSGSVLDGQSYHVPTWFSQLACQPLVAGAGSEGGTLNIDAEGESGRLLGLNEQQSVGTFNLEEGTTYRAGAHVVSQACDGECAQARLEIGSTLSSVHTTSTAAASIGMSLSGTAGEYSLVTENLGGAASYSGLTLIEEGQANTFDTPFDRLEATLFALRESSFEGPATMRFTGDGEQGFLALLLPAERMVLSRQALLPDRTWTVRVEASTYDGLSCGFVDGYGEPVVSAPCAPLFSLTSSELTPSGFFVEMAASGEAVELQAVALASDAAPDVDGDGTADVLDDCVSNPDGGCRFSPEERDAGAPPAVEDAGSGGASTLDMDADVSPRDEPDAASSVPFDSGSGGARSEPSATPVDSQGGSDAGQPLPNQGGAPSTPTAPAPSASPIAPPPTDSADAGTAMSAADGGCDCTLNERGGSVGWLAALGLALGLARRRTARERR